MLRASASGIPPRSANLLRRQTSLGRWCDRTSLGRYVRRARRTPVFARVPEHQCLRRGTGQTRTISLGIGPIGRPHGGDQAIRGSVSTRDYPLVTPSNCTLIARGGPVTWAGLALLVLPRAPRSCHPSGRGRRVQARAATAERLGLDSVGSAEIMEQRGVASLPPNRWPARPQSRHAELHPATPPVNMARRTRHHGRRENEAPLLARSPSPLWASIRRH